MTKATIITTTGTATAVIASLFGGWDYSLKILLVLMVLDYLTGLMTAIVGKSTKTEQGHLDSRAGLLGIFRKMGILIGVIIGTVLQNLSGLSFCRDVVCISFILNETISLLENLGLLGVPIPDVLINVIEVLKKKEGDYVQSGRENND